MNPSTGTFISMDSYQGNVYDPVTLHKYLYANANPVKYTDPTGYFSISESSVATTIQSTLSSVNNFLRLHGIIRWANAICTVYDTAMEIRNVILGGGTVGDVIVALLKGVVVGFMLDGMCKTPLGIILKPMMAIFGLSSQVEQIQGAIKRGDSVEIAVRFVQLICMLFGISSQCFTAETLVSTEEGLIKIADINVGDYVWTENVETGEKELKQVLQVYINETDTLVHLSITDENDSETIINTTENHPFYIDGKGWITASQLKTGDKLRTKDGKIQVVKEVSVEKLDELVKVYNLEVDNQHTYYVSDREVLVHNDCTSSNEKTYYHVTTDDNAKMIIETGQLKNGKWESFVFAWSQQPTKKQASIAGISSDATAVIKFKTNASFEADTGNSDIDAIKDIVLQTTKGQRLPISISEIEIVGFKKEWWQFWKR